MWSLRHDDDGEVQPVPWIPQKGEGHDTESSGKDLYNWLESVNSSKSVPEKYSQGKTHSVPEFSITEGDKGKVWKKGISL